MKRKPESQEVKNKRKELFNAAVRIERARLKLEREQQERQRIDNELSELLKAVLDPRRPKSFLLDGESFCLTDAEAGMADTNPIQAIKALRERIGSYADSGQYRLSLLAAKNVIDQYRNQLKAAGLSRSNF